MPIPLEASQVINITSATHYAWRDNCDGWHLVNSDALSIIQERMPPGASEVQHYHQQARQFFFVLSGELVVEVTKERFTLRTNDGIAVPPLAVHRVVHQSTEDAVFMVTSTPKSHGDRFIITT